jgi:hypothetical protein
MRGSVHLYIYVCTYLCNVFGQFYQAQEETKLTQQPQKFLMESLSQCKKKCKQQELELGEMRLVKSIAA